MSRNRMLGSIVAGLFVLCALSTWSSPTWSSEADELRERAKAIEREAAELAEKGHTDAAEELEQEALKLLESAERSAKKNRSAHQSTDFDQHIDKLEVHAVELRDLLERLRDEDASEREQVEAKERLLDVHKELHHLRAERKAALAGAKRHLGYDIKGEHAAKIDAAAERIRHIWTAAEHLDKAGVHDLAGQLRSKAASMKQELGEQTKRLKKQAVHHVKKDHKATAAEVVELRQLVERLQAEIKELREQAERR